jgi:photosystem II stability/assembly factor-like uncharacterized protein
MKKWLVLFSILLFVASDAAAQDWVQTNGPFGSEIRSIVFNKNKHIFILSDQLLRSTDNGTSWKRLIPDLSITAHGCIAIASNDDIYISNVYAHNYVGLGILKSTDNGDSWIQVSSKNAYQILVGADSIIIAPCSFQDSLFTVDTPIYLLKSENAGKTWGYISFPLNNAGSIYRDSKGHFIIGSFGFILKSPDGISWSKITNGLVKANYHDFAFGKNGNIWAEEGFRPTSAEMLVHSTDYGESWMRFNWGFQSGLLKASKEGRFLFAGPKFIKYSDDNGITWKDFGGLDQGICTKEYQFFLSADSDSGFYLKDDRLLLHGSVPGAQPWQVISLPISRPTRIITHPDGSLLCTTNDGQSNGLWRSSDKGISWIPVNNVHAPILSIAIDSNKNIFAGSSYGFYRSINSGKDWSFISVPKVLYFSSIAVHPNGTMFATNLSPNSSNSMCFKSADSGITWNKIEGLDMESAHSIAIDLSGNIFLGGTKGITISKDSGITWKLFPVGTSAVNGIVSDFYGDFFINDGHGMYLSIDTLKTISSFNAGLKGSIINCLLSTPGGIVFAATDSGVFSHNPKSCFWTPYSTGLDNINILSLAIDKEGRLFAGSGGSGVYKSVETFNIPSGLTGFINAGNTDFGTIEVGDTICKEVLIKNYGFAPFSLTKSLIFVDPTPFSLDPESYARLPLVLNPQDSVMMKVCFHPQQKATYSSEIDWATDIDPSLCIGMKYQSFLQGVAIQIESTVLPSLNNFHFTLRPNPIAGNILTVFFSQVQDHTVSLLIYDLLGRKVARKEIGPGILESEVAISDLPEGMYYVRVVFEGRVYSDQFVKN